jgi:DNA-binding cell septation regulator SpoVG
MLGFLSVELSSGLIIKDLRLMVGPNAGGWITMLARQQMDRDGRPGRSASGKPIWSDSSNSKTRRQAIGSRISSSN